MKSDSPSSEPTFCGAVQPVTALDSRSSDAGADMYLDASLTLGRPTSHMVPTMPVEQLAPAARFGSVEADGELVEDRHPDASGFLLLVGAQQPAFEQHDRQMDAWHQLRADLLFFFRSVTSAG
jgi:hypothetical protein